MKSQLCHLALTWPRHWQSVQLEGVGRVAMRCLLLQVARQVDDGDRLEWTLLDADAAADAELLRDGGDLVIRRHLDAELAHSNNWNLFDRDWATTQHQCSKMHQRLTWALNWPQESARSFLSGFCSKIFNIRLALGANALLKSTYPFSIKSQVPV